MDFYGFIEVLLVLVLGLGGGWAFGSEVNKAKIYNLLVKPFTKKEKMVVRISGEESDEREFLADRPLGEEPIIIKMGKTRITKFLLPRLNKMKKGVVIGQFDNRSPFQQPLETSHLVATLVVNQEGKVVAKSFVENQRVIDSQPSSQAAQNLLINSVEWAEGQAMGEVNEDFKKLKKFIYIGIFLSVVTLIIGLLGAKYGSDSLNLIGGLKAVQTNATVLTFPPA